MQAAGVLICAVEFATRDADEASELGAVTTRSSALLAWVLGYAIAQVVLGIMCAAAQRLAPHGGFAYTNVVLGVGALISAACAGAGWWYSFDVGAPPLQPAAAWATAIKARFPLPDGLAGWHPAYYVCVVSAIVFGAVVMVTRSMMRSSLMLAPVVADVVTHIQQPPAAAGARRVCFSFDGGPSAEVRALSQVRRPHAPPPTCLVLFAHADTRAAGAAA